MMPTAGLSQAINPLGKTWTMGYDLNGQLTSSTDPLGHVTSYGYDSSGQLGEHDQSAGRGQLGGLRRCQQVDRHRSTRWAIGLRLSTTRPTTRPPW